MGDIVEEELEESIEEELIDEEDKELELLLKELKLLLKEELDELSVDELEELDSINSLGFSSEGFVVLKETLKYLMFIVIESNDGFSIVEGSGIDGLLLDIFFTLIPDKFYNLSK